MSSHHNSENKQAGRLQYWFSIFLGAFLLFAVQLLLAKYFLPWFGGTPAMWTTCMFFFQMLLLAGYAYAHALANWFSPRVQSVLHFAVLLSSLLLLASLTCVWHSPLTPDVSWRPHSRDHPIGSIIALLAVSVGLPYFALSSTGPLLQSWFTRTHPGHIPYRLYSLSNLGSFLALLSYPSLVEPWLTLKTQARLWSLGFLAYAVACGYCALQVGRSKTPKSSSQHNSDGRTLAGGAVGGGRPSVGTHLLWLSLAACASVMFLSTTNQICQDIAVIPFLWVLPLSLYLLSFVICFDKPEWYSRGVWHPAFALAIFLACFVLNGGALTRIIIQILVYCFALFTGCMVCHGELARSKPNSRYLTSFYLMVAAGGAMGGILVALIAPHLFRAFWEYQLGLLGSVLLMFLMLMRDKGSWLYCSRFGLPSLGLYAASLPGCLVLAVQTKTRLDPLIPVLPVLVAVSLLARKGRVGFDEARARAVPLYCGAALLVLGAVLVSGARTQIQNSALVSRNFYGILTVRELNADQPDWRAYSLSHGRIPHGFQFCSTAKRGLPTSYYGSTSGVGRALIELQARSLRSASQQNLRIGVVGLGVGTLAAYAKAGDYVRFYEINPEVLRIASEGQYFSFLKDCPARLDVIQGDARLSMERELERGQPQHFDLVAIDAFSGDAPPVHLLTEEAFQIYLSEIKNPDGIIAVNITNTYLDLRPVLARTAEHFKLKYVWVHSDGDSRITKYNDWVLLSRNESFLNSLAIPIVTAPNQARVVPLWTDDYSNLFRVLRR